MMKPELTNLYLTPLSQREGAAGRRDRSMRPVRDPRGRFVTQSHVLSAPRARPVPLAIAAAVAVALVIVTRRLTH
jgi:hypothetical protein